MPNIVNKEKEIMPYVEHPAALPPNDNFKIWRYVDFSLFMSLLEEKALYFSNLASFRDDPFEGSVTEVTINKMAGTPNGTRNLKMFNAGKSLMYASCWHLNEDESAAMCR